MNNQFYESLKNNHLFKNTDITSLNLDEVKGRLVRVGEGEIVYREGAASDFIYLVVSGQINIIKKKILGKAKSYIYNENEFFGNDEYFEEINRTSTAIALLDSYLIVFTREEIENLILQDNEIYLTLRENLSGLFDNATEIAIDETEAVKTGENAEIDKIITGEEIKTEIDDANPLIASSPFEHDFAAASAPMPFETEITPAEIEPVIETPADTDTQNILPKIEQVDDTTPAELLTEEDFSILEENAIIEEHPLEEEKPKVSSTFSLTDDDLSILEKSAVDNETNEAADAGIPAIPDDDILIASLINQDSEKTVPEEPEIIPAENEETSIETGLGDEFTPEINVLDPNPAQAKEEDKNTIPEPEEIPYDNEEKNTPVLFRDETGGEMNAQEVNKIIKAMELVNSNIKIDDLLANIVTVATDLTNADRGTLYLVDKEKGELWSKIAMGTEPKEIRLKIGEGIAGCVAHTKVIENIKDVSNHPMFKKDIDKASGYVTKNMLCFPLKNKEDDVIGVLQLLNSKNGEFSSSDEEVLSMISINTSIALQNAELVEKLLTAERVSSLGKMTNFLIQDIKKPVLVSKRYTEHLKSKNLAPEVTQLVDMILTELTQVADLVQTTSSYAEGKTILRTTITGINATLQDFIGRMEQHVISKHCKINFDPDKEINVKIDIKEFFQCFQHLVKNACDAMPDGGILTIRTKNDGKTVKIIFEDQGLGIPESFIEKIFEPFMTYGKKEGAGLGLSITRKIIEAHQGRIDVKSALGAGAEFTITLPAGSSL
jgi:putative methionine-R-sulfoxide reductase with GAF domain/anti-sigma regulatory factor (Ser/Thr protein kinase)